MTRLLQERTAARAARDWPAADALRDRIRDAGWEPIDTPDGSTARPILAPTSAHLPSLLDQEAAVEASVLVLLDDYPDDLARLLQALVAHAPKVAWELLIVANAPLAPVEPILAANWPEDGPLPEAVVLPSAARLGWADAVNLGLRRSRGVVVVLLDTSLEPIGDILAPLLAAFEDARVGIAGGWGVTSPDAREFVEAPPGEVDAIEGYCMAIRREALRAVGGFDHGYRYYRHADLDISFAIRDAGWRAIRTDPLPVTLHEHRGWEGQAPDERDRLSKRNFYRFLKRWRHRPDLLLRPAGGA
ncbi:MAG: glycosyltransferase [Chloroflexota bacterium]